MRLISLKRYTISNLASAQMTSNEKIAMITLRPDSPDKGKSNNTKCNH